MLSLLALGTGFQVRLIGQVVAAHADRLDEPDKLGRTIRSVLTAALDGRLAPVAEQWLGIDPDQVEVSLYRGTGWGSVELTGRGEQRRLRVLGRPSRRRFDAENVEVGLPQGSKRLPARRPSVFGKPSCQILCSLIECVGSGLRVALSHQGPEMAENAGPTIGQGKVSGARP